MKPLPDLDPNREIVNLEGEGLGLTIAQYDASRPAAALANFRTLCHAPFAVIDLGPQGQVTTCNHFHRFLGNLHDKPWLDIFRGEDWSRLRQNMLEYRISEMDCRHCARQIRSGHGGNAFAQEHFDEHAATTHDPQYPTVIIFRLSNACNLKCVMCNGMLSHRIRKEREKLPPLDPPPYDENFFREMEEVLPHVKYVEFYGGEPFLVKEHLRILDIIERTGSQTAIYVNTNGTVLTPRIKGYIERLNFIKIAVSVDAVTEVVHARQRVDIDHQACMRNLQWLLDLRARKQIWIGLNTTETRFNWYHLPDLFRFAAERDVYVHINTCLHPSDCTLYDLPTEELAYIGDFFARQREQLGDLLEVRGNTRSYGHLQAMVADELEARRAGRKRPNPYPTNRPPIHGGLMSVPEIKASPFAEPRAALDEIRRLESFAVWRFALRLGRAWREALADEDPRGPWGEVRRELEQLIERVEPRVEPQLEQLSEESLAAVIHAAWAHERAGELEAARAAVAHLPDEGSPLHYDALLLRGRVQRRCGELEAAEQTLSQATAAAPQRPEAVVEQAWLHLDRRDSEAAVRLARRARELTTSGEPAQVAAWAHALGAAAAAAGRYEETAEALERLRAVLPGAPATQELARERDRLAVQAGWRRESRGDFAGALAAAEVVGEHSPYASEARRLQARLLRRSGQTAAARQLLEELVRAEPTRAEAIVELAWLCLDCEDVDAGLQLARRARELARHSRGRDDNDQWAHVLAALATSAAAHRDAADALQVLLARRQPKPAAHPLEQRDCEALAAAARHEEQGEWEQALAALAHLGPGSALQYDAAVLRARVLRRSGRDQAARRTLAIAIAIDPARWEAIVELAWRCLEAGELDSGQRLAHLALEARRSNGDARGTAAAAHALALLAAAAGDRATAVAALERLESARPDGLDTAAVRDEALRQLGERV